MREENSEKKISQQNKLQKKKYRREQFPHFHKTSCIVEECKGCSSKIGDLTQGKILIECSSSNL